MRLRRLTRPRSNGLGGKPTVDDQPSQAVVLEPNDSPLNPLAPWFEPIRTHRRAQYARQARATPRRRALVTIVHNEPVFLPIWLRYYQRFFAPEDIYVLDNESTDDAIGQGGFVRMPVPHDSVDHVWMVRELERTQHELLDNYELVLVTDVDEIIAPDPRFGTLGDYLDRFDEEWVNCLGYELLHMPGQPPLQLGQPILAQRDHWFCNQAYNKAGLATVPMSWRPGLHSRSDLRMNVDPDLRLIHLHRMDYELCLERHRVRSRKPWAERDTRQQWAIHNQITDDAAFRRWFYEDSCVENVEIKPELIPDDWRSIF